MKPVENGNEAYKKIVLFLKRRSRGVTIADLCAGTALPLSLARELLPKAADEYRGALEVTGSGEILYSFPHGFTSRYHGPGAIFKRFSSRLIEYLGITGAFLFKIWIMVMLVGYFVLFLAIAIGSLFLSMAAQSNSKGNNRRGSVRFTASPFSMLWRLWFYSELTRPYKTHVNQKPPKKNRRAMHKAIFSFVFGEPDPNKNWKEREHKAVIAYIQGNRGTISLGEYMAFSGKNSADAEEDLLSFCVLFHGSPEVTAEGTIVYYFDELMLRADKQKFAELSPPVQRLKQFSGNPKTMNVWFIIINAVNLIFGSYFIYHSLATGLLVLEEQFQSASYLYAYTQLLLYQITANPLPVITMGLGLIPLLFSILFWIIPALRHFLEARENEKILTKNFKRLGFSRIWANPLNFGTDRLDFKIAECRPKNTDAAGDRVIKEMGAHSTPEVTISPEGKTLFSFVELEREKKALQQYRQEIDSSRWQLGETVFDSRQALP
ncbi:MAG: hypothetical protein FWG99_01500 [Treponema sp.]|nr:hypothetical protein [Treponema sp.]